MVCYVGFASWVSLGSFWRALWFRRGSLGSFGPALGVVWFRWVHSSAPFGSLGSFGLVGFIYTRHGGRPVYLGSLCSIGRALVFVGFTPTRRWVHSCSIGRVQDVVGFILARWVHSGAPWGSSCSFGFVQFPRARPRCGRVQSGVP